MPCAHLADTLMVREQQTKSLHPSQTISASAMNVWGGSGGGIRVERSTWPELYIFSSAYSGAVFPAGPETSGYREADEAKIYTRPMRPNPLTTHHVHPQRYIQGIDSVTSSEI